VNLAFKVLGWTVGLYAHKRSVGSASKPMTLTQYHENNAVRRPEFMHIRGVRRGECPGCLYVKQHGRTPFGAVLEID